MWNYDGVPKEGVVEAINELMKHNIEVESERLREEFMYNQREYKDILDKAQWEADWSMKQRNAAYKELQRL